MGLNSFREFVASGYPFHSAKIPLAIRPWRGLQAAASRLVSMPGACDPWLADDWELERIPAYIESNPVRVGSVDRAQIPIGQRRKSVETSLDAADTSGRANPASINAYGGPAPQCAPNSLAESKGYPLEEISKCLCS